MQAAAKKGCHLVVFGEAMLPGYPFWIELTDGEWIVEPVVGREELMVVRLDYQRVREERQNFDPAGHYSRPDVTQLTLNLQ